MSDLIHSLNQSWSENTLYSTSQQSQLTVAQLDQQWSQCVRHKPNVISTEHMVESIPSFPIISICLKEISHCRATALTRGKSPLSATKRLVRLGTNRFAVLPIPQMTDRFPIALHFWGTTMFSF